MKKQAVIFDFDGVIAHTTPLHIAAWIRAFRDHGVTFTPDDYRQKASGWGREQAIKNVLPDADEKTVQRIAEKKHTHFSDVLTTEKLQSAPGARSLIKELQKQNYKLAVASSSNFAPILLERLGLSHNFSAIVSAKDVTHHKPHPALFLAASERLGIDPEACIVIEDALSGITAAKAAHMHVIGLLQTDKSLADHADFSVSSLRKYPLILEHIKTYQ